MKNNPLLCLLFLAATALANSAPDGWNTAAPRDEIKPRFAFLPKGGPDEQGSFVIESDERYGLFGQWTKTFPVKGGGPDHRVSLLQVASPGKPFG